MKKVRRQGKSKKSGPYVGSSIDNSVEIDGDKYEVGDDDTWTNRSSGGAFEIG